MAREIDLDRHTSPAWTGRQAGWRGTAADEGRAAAMRHIGEVQQAQERGFGVGKAAGLKEGEESGLQDGMFNAREQIISRIGLLLDTSRDSEETVRELRAMHNELKEMHDTDKADRQRRATGEELPDHPIQLWAGDVAIHQTAELDVRSGLDISGNTTG